MRRTYSRLLPLILLLAASGASAQTASLVKDINPGLGSATSLSVSGVASVGGKVLFRADESSSGGELWSVDGSGTGARLLADLCPGQCSSDPVPLGTFHSLLLGLARLDFGSGNAYLWRSDGTRQGTFLLPDPRFQVFLRYDFFGEDPPPVAFGRDVVYFSGCDRDQGCQLWRTDGSPEGTRLVKAVLPTDNYSGPGDLTIVGDRLFFTIYHQLWVSDGTSGGTVLVKELQSTPRRLAALGAKVFFLAQGTAGEELWVSDGTAAGTQVLTSFSPDQPFRQTLFLKALGGKIYFVADDAEHGAELWRSDGTPSGTVRITDFGFHDPFNWDDLFGDGGLRPGSLALLGGRVVFWATDGLNGFNLWSTQGTPESTAPVCASCNFYSSDASPTFFPVGSRLLFLASGASQSGNVWATDGTSQGTRPACTGCNADSELAAGPGGVYFSAGFSELWKSDGTPQGSRSLAKIDVSKRPDESPDLAFLGTAVYAVVRLDGGADQEIWRIDGPPAGSGQVTAGTRENSADVAGTVAVGDRVYFTACEGEDVRRVWYSRAGGETARAADEPLLSCRDQTSFLTAAGGKVFLAQFDFNPFNSAQLWKIGQGGGATLLASFTSRYVDSFVPFAGQLFFVVSRGTGISAELWKSDGTPQGTGKAIDLPAELNTVKYLRVVGSNLWFLAEDYGSTGEVWRTDGTQSGTVRVFSGSRTTHDPEATQVGSQVYFVALRPGTDDYDYQIYKTDATLNGATAVTDFPGLNATRATPGSLTAFLGNLYFAAFLPTGEGPSLWRSDGTPAGTVPLRTFAKPVNSNFGDPPPIKIRVLGSQLLLSADDGVHGLELWRSDGTAAGTALLRDVDPGPGGSQPANFLEAGGLLYFSATDGLHGFELWRTDGTTAGTRLVQDIAPEGPSSYPTGLTLAGNQIFFAADDGITGDELWALPLSGPACQPSATALCLSGGRYRVEAAWRDFSQNSGFGQAVPLSADTGYFWFFDPSNVETVVKVLDGQGVNGHNWVFYGALSNVEYTLTVTDTQTGLARRYFNLPGQFASVGDTTAFGPLGAALAKRAGAPEAQPRITERIDLAAATGTCVPGSSRLCLNGGRFAVETTWKDFSGHTGTGTAVGLTGDTGYFWFFNAANVEMVLKVLDGRPVNGHFWVYYGALSNVEYTVTVTDTMTGTVKTYKNPSGQFASVGDGGAF